MFSHKFKDVKFLLVQIYNMTILSNYQNIEPQKIILGLRLMTFGACILREFKDDYYDMMLNRLIDLVFYREEPLPTHAISSHVFDQECIQIFVYNRKRLNNCFSRLKELVLYAI
ncbi:hypothetical protein RF11_02691 [Thelohanellus kitauei]|uniref:Uncharacterized protein n=1 Tax=Thelohanellus kitauei TaxID=669202 RepID=A0A0C2MDP9_THEKT|nr:hypothetical protein RF11_02691 [Thelohanellus kitauei]